MAHTSLFVCVSHSFLLETRHFRKCIVANLDIDCSSPGFVIVISLVIGWTVSEVYSLTYRQCEGPHVPPQEEEPWVVPKR